MLQNIHSSIVTVDKNLAVIPKPYQQPHPPMWAACTSPDGFRIAGELGVGALGVTLMTPVETMKTLLDTYREAVKDANPAGSFGTSVVTFSSDCRAMTSWLVCMAASPV